MGLSIGVFTAKYSMKNILRTTELFDESLSFSFFPYTSAEQLFSLYSKHAQEFDGLLFSGILPYQLILAQIGEPTKPYKYFDVTDRDYYKALLRAVCVNPGLDIRRIWVEYSTPAISWDEVFDDIEIRPIIDPMRINIQSYDEDAYMPVLENYRQLWQSREVDLFITRLTSQEPFFVENGIPYELLLPSKTSMVETTKALVDEIMGSRVRDCLSAVGVLSPNGPLTPDEAHRLPKILREFNNQQGMSLILRRDDECYDIITSSSVLHDLTDGFSGCRLSDFLSAHSDIDFSLGWGMGTDVLHAQQNARRALKESVRSAEHHSYLITETDVMIGPLVRGKSAELSAAPSAEAAAYAKELSISPAVMQKLVMLYRRQGSLRVSRHELASYLNVTTRTVTRILKKLTDAGAAQIVAAEQPNGPGRPTAIYKIELDRLAGK